MNIQKVLNSHQKWLCDGSGQRADLREADLRRVDLRRANLRGAKLWGARYLYSFQIAPQEGEFIGFKKTREGNILKLLIVGERVNKIGSRKCRTSRVKVLEGSGYSTWDKSFKYIEGEVIEVTNFDPDIRRECSSGIHFFLTREEAEDY